MTREELVAAVLAERFPPLDVVERERPPTPAEFERRRRVLVEGMSRYGLRGRVGKAAA